MMSGIWRSQHPSGSWRRITQTLAACCSRLLPLRLTPKLSAIETVNLVKRYQINSHHVPATSFKFQGGGRHGAGAAETPCGGYGGASFRQSSGITAGGKLPAHRRKSTIPRNAKGRAREAEQEASSASPLGKAESSRARAEQQRRSAAGSSKQQPPSTEDRHRLPATDCQ